MKESVEEAFPLEDGRFEIRLAVDRRRLESMITGTPLSDDPCPLPNAELFFEQVQQISGATILWPAQLKIGAKTKRDPFVKIQGTMVEIEKAKSLISSSLHCKKERATLKMEIHHSIHSHIIGKGGKGIQQIMRSTRCHIHFPDSNKFNSLSLKSDQVSIAGVPSDVENARKLLRDITPIIISTELPWKQSGTPPELPFNDIVTVQFKSGCTYVCSIRGSVGDEQGLHYHLKHLMKHFHLPLDFPLRLQTTLSLKEDVLQMLSSKSYEKKLNEISSNNEAEIMFSSGGMIIRGSFEGVLVVRRMILGFTPICLSFDLPISFTPNISLVEKTFNLVLTTKKRTNQPGTISVLIKSVEEYVDILFRARDLLLGNDNLEDIFDTNYAPHIDDYLSNMPLTCHSPSNLKEMSMTSFAVDVAKSPDPEDSPLAASILKGVKNLKPKSDRWDKKGGLCDRDQMLAKAAHALYEENATGDRYPTDHWAGYGFSCSMPADLLKGLTDTMNKPNTSMEQHGRMIVGQNAKPSTRRGLFSVQEEDEFSDYSGSFSSVSGHSMQKNFERPTRVNNFSASTSIFDASPLIGDFRWDIRAVSDPAMVLAQLGCSEYMAQMREQEIDMHAFLLLDESSLKDIGVSTIGARKKIHHAIIKLRESARQQGLTF